uniref:protein FAM200C-like n=1 Tax=Myxine glutinosa TaxID=7769 RepID=UPI0035902D18
MSLFLGMSKKRTYNGSFLNFGFSSIVNNGVQLPQCVICKKTLANESLKPFKLKEHLAKVHPELASKDLAYFKIKEHQLKRSRLDHGTGVLFQHSKIVEASYKISLLIAKQKKPHTIGEMLVKPCMVEAARLVLDQNCVNKLNQISLSDNTVKQRIDDMSQDIKLQVEEEFLFCSPLITTTKAEDVMNMVSNFFQEEKLSWAKLTLPAALKVTLETVIRIVNHIKGGALNTRLFRQLCQDMDSAHQDLLFYTSVRWLSKGNVLACVFELFDELQGPDTTIIMHTDAIKAFLDKLALWERKVERGNVASFQCLTEVVGEEPLAEELQQEIKEHLSSLQEEFRHYFHEIDANENVQLKLARNPFRCTMDDLPDGIQEEFLELINNTAAKKEFQEQQQFSSSNCWAKMLSAFPKTSEFALKVLIPFSSTYLCESGFSTLLVIKSNARNRLDAEADMRCALSHTDPRIDLLVSKKQIHPSH